MKVAWICRVSDPEKMINLPIYYSNAVVRRFVENPNMVANFIILNYKQLYLDKHYKFGDQHIYEIIYTNK